MNKKSGNMSVQTLQKDVDAVVLEEKLEPFADTVNTKLRELAKELKQKYGIYNTRIESVRELELHARREFFDKGKRYRPLLVAAACKAVGGDISDAIPLALAFEQTHRGYLTTDDKIDKTLLRHKNASIYALLGSDRAVLVGMYNSDALPWFSIAEGLKIWDKDVSQFIISLLGSVKLETVRGEYLDLLYRANLKLNTEVQPLIYELKTGAYTNGGPIAGGARIGGASPIICKKLFVIGKEYFSRGFQHIDDILNLISPAEYGKEFADDLIEGKPTYIVAYFNENASESDKKEFYRLFGRGAVEDLTITVDNLLRLHKMTGKKEYLRFAEQTERKLGELKRRFGPKFGDPLSMDERKFLISKLEHYGALQATREYAKEQQRLGLQELAETIPRVRRSEELYNLIEYAFARNW